MTDPTQPNRHALKTSQFIQKLREAYQEAYSKAVETGKQGYDEIRRQREQLEPRLRDEISQRWQQTKTMVDDFNRSLADRAIPDARRQNVLKKHLEQKSDDGKAGAKRRGRAAAKKVRKPTGARRSLPN